MRLSMLHSPLSALLLHLPPGCWPLSPSLGRAEGFRPFSQLLHLHVFGWCPYSFPALLLLHPPFPGSPTSHPVRRLPSVKGISLFLCFSLFYYCSVPSDLNSDVVASVWFTCSFPFVPLTEFHVVFHVSVSPVLALSPFHRQCSDIPLSAHGCRGCITVINMPRHYSVAWM